MKIKIRLLLAVIVCFLATNKVCAQAISLSGPTTPVASETIVTFTVMGETANKHVGSVPKSADAINNDLLVPGVSCILWDTDYYANGVSGKFNYKLINENTVSKTVQLKFRIVVVAYAANGALTTTDEYFSCIVTVGPSLKNAITINGVPKVETILFGADCGFVHAYGTPTYSPGHMEKDVWKFAYDVNYTKVNSSVLDSDIYWEWLVEDNSQYIPLEKQFITYPYGTGRLTQLNGNKKVTIEANDLLDEYSSKARVWARSRSTGSRLSSDYILYLSGVNH